MVIPDFAGELPMTVEIAVIAWSAKSAVPAAAEPMTKLRLSTNSSLVLPAVIMRAGFVDRQVIRHVLDPNAASPRARVEERAVGRNVRARRNQKEIDCCGEVIRQAWLAAGFQNSSC